MIKNNILEAIGKTPLIRLNKINNTNAEILVKIEGMNPGGSHKDRPALAMIEDAEKKGILHKESVVIEATSGNAGIGLSMVCAVKGYKIIIIMPDTMSIERRQILKAYGAKVVLVDGKLGMKGCIEKLEELKKKYDDVFTPSQFENFSNSESHEKTTAKEILDATKGRLDIFVAGIGSGGVISGVSQGLKAKNNKIKTYGVEPEESPLFTKGYIGKHKIQGIGVSIGEKPKILNLERLDGVLTASYEEALKVVGKLAKEEGILCGISSGAVLAAALKLGENKENKGKRIVVLLSDTGERYLSSGIFDQI